MFCKLFETEEYGQILVKFDQSDKGNPELRFYIEPPDSGVCSMSLEWPDTDEGWRLAEAGLEDCTEEKAGKVAKSLLGAIHQEEDIE